MNALSERSESKSEIVKYYTYILSCQNGKYYAGHSVDVLERFKRYLSKAGAKFTSQNKPIKVLWKQVSEAELEAVKREKQIKGWSRSKKEKLIRGIWK